MKWILEILKIILSGLWGKKKEVDVEKELEDTKKANIELKGQMAAQEVRHDILIKETKFDEEMSKAEATPETVDDYEALKRDFPSHSDK